MPSWAILGLSFIGGSQLEIITDVRLVQKVIGSLKLLNIVELKGFDVAGDAMKNRKRRPSALTEESARRQNIEMALKRISRCRETTTNESARQWYSKELYTLQQILTNMGSPSETDKTTSTPPGTVQTSTKNSKHTPDRNDEGWTLVTKQKGSQKGRLDTNNSAPTPHSTDNADTDMPDIQEKQTVAHPMTEMPTRSATTLNPKDILQRPPESDKVDPANAKTGTKLGTHDLAQNNQISCN